MAEPRPPGSRHSATPCLPASEPGHTSAYANRPAHRGAGSVESAVPAASVSPAPVGPADRKDYRYRYVNGVAILHELARQLGEVGVRATVNALDKREFLPLIEAGRSDLHLLGYACESGDAGDVLGALLHSATGAALGSLNSLGLSDRLLDERIEAADRARTDTERARRLRLAVARAAELRTALPFVVQTEAVVLSRRLGWDAPLNMAIVPEDIRPAP